MANNYYAQKLNSQKLFQVYDTKLPRVLSYLKAEIEYVKGHLNGSENVLELGAGYGRIVRELSPFCSSLTGIDISEESVSLSREYLKDFSNAHIEVMDIHKLAFTTSFDVVLCLQNGLSAMRASTETIGEILNLLAPEGRAYFSSYSNKFWEHRLEWFSEQASKCLLGEIDYEKTKEGIIICNDGFKATTHSREDFENIGKSSGYKYFIEEIDESSIFLVIKKVKTK